MQSLYQSFFGGDALGVLKYNNAVAHAHQAAISMIYFVTIRVLKRPEPHVFLESKDGFT